MFYHITNDLQVIETEKKVSLNYASKRNLLFVNFYDYETASEVAQSANR